MSPAVPGRRQETLLAVSVGVIALLVLAIALAGSGGLFAIDGTADTPDPPDIDRTGLIGGGSLGDAIRNPIGSGVDNESNPFESTDTEVEFWVDTDTPGYWRIDGYDTYADGVWERTGTPGEYRDGIGETGTVMEVINHTVTIERDAASLPVTWQPATVSLEEDVPMSVTPELGIHMPTPLAAASTYTVESYCFNPDAEEVTHAGAEYPVSIEERYTALPDDIPERVSGLSEDLIGDVEDPLEAAETVGDWLAENAEYSREATHPSGEEPIDSFLFETRSGTAEYFASSAVVMLRSEGIPARYVVGYAPGERLEHAADRYAVREINAHAWIEIYMPGIGWIPYDPTPTDERHAVERAFIDPDGELVDVPIGGDCELPPDEEPPWLDNGGDNDLPPDNGDPNNDTDPGDPGNGNGGDPGNGSDPGNGDDPDGNETDNGDNGDPDTDLPPGIEIELSDPNPTPGQDIVVTVTRDGDPVAGANVRFNGDPIGSTDVNGQVTGTVPFAQTLEISVSLPSDDETAFMPPPTGDHLGYAGVGPSAYDAHARLLGGHAGTLSEENATLSIPLTAEVGLSVTPDILVIGGEATVQATIDEFAIPDAEIYIDETHVGTTDADGYATIAVPETLTPGTTVVTVRRGDLSAQQTMTVGELVLSAPDRVLALPGQAVEVHASAGGQSLPGVDIIHDGAVLDTTDEDGVATIPMGIEPSMTISGSFGGSTVSISITNLLAPVVGVIAVVLLVVGLVAMVSNRRRDTGDGLGRLLSGIRRRTLGWVLTVIDRLDGVVQAVSGILAIDGDRSVGQSLVALSRWMRRTVGSIRVHTILQAGMSVVRWLQHGIRSLPGALRSAAGSDPDASGSIDATTLGGDSTTERSLRDVWARFVRLVVGRAAPTLTPGEIGRRAIDMGLPERPVRRLMNAFRAIEYGPERPPPEASEAADSLAAIEDAHSRAHDPDDRSQPSETERQPSGD